MLSELFAGTDVIHVKTVLVDSVCVLPPVSDVLPPPHVLLAAVGTPFWKKKHHSFHDRRLVNTSNRNSYWCAVSLSHLSHTHNSTLLLLTSAAAYHLLASADGSQYGLLQTGLHVLRFFER